ncbi:hypothetical protein [Mitsuaria sp. GD03876]|uniref:hypothetical protein n=1 Tax=Mitsuaria sp. GD03876 TaxID=2975399 RepID=UPI002447724E|nr:hypothetical protein [Mitsuaria sp. GD03876]MDH0868131.1 hypothetical protein [Mitsuaria sp. GD03876]
MKTLVTADDSAIFDRDAWHRFMSGYFIRDCTIGFEDGRLGFLLYEETEDRPMEEGFQIRILAIKLANPMETRFFSMSANGLGVGAQLCSAWAPQDAGFVGVGIGLEVYAYKPKVYKGREDDIPFEVRKLHPEAYSDFGAAVLKTARVGTTVFAVGGPLRLFERVGAQQWKEHADIPLPVDIGSADREVALAAIGDSSFRDLAGLSVEDMYAVGDRGAVWRRQEGRWSRLPFPGSQRLNTVSVTPDGTVYVTDLRGSVWRGRDLAWELIVEADNAMPYQDAAWFKGRLYCANDSAGCFVLEDGAMVAAHRAKRDPMPVATAMHAHRLDVAPDGQRLLIAGMHGASMYDGKTWQRLFDGEPPVDRT